MWALPWHDVNVLISSFDTAFNEHFDQIVQDAYAGSQNIAIDSLINTIETRYKKFSHPFFAAYRLYRYGLLSQLSLMQKARSISDSYFLNKPILYNNPSYMELFNHIRQHLFFARDRFNRRYSTIYPMKKLYKAQGNPQR